ncbi:MAG: flagellar hook-basal body complex protein [Anaerotruncus sp.]|nr:flagellar hook-basal body complex protein [Anaerotruncus sp.]
MVRSMFSGVAGMRAHQQRMDVIGNNIANVNTYGFKSSRATFRDMYYQNIRNASAGTVTRGGVNPSAIGYGANISSVDLLMTQSSMTPTGNPLDVCITGEGFLQVMDNDGNIFYTKAGMLDVDPTTGYLLDSNGYFVLGTQGPSVVGKAPSKEKIQFKIDPLTPAAGTKTETINDRDVTISATNNSSAGNVQFNFSLDTEMPAGQDLNVIMDGTNISVKVNPLAEFTSFDAFVGLVNQKITEANGGTPHPGGEFSIVMDPAPDLANKDIYNGKITGTQLVNPDNGPTGGKIEMLTSDDSAGKLGVVFRGVGSAFTGNTAAAAGGTQTPLNFQITANGTAPDLTFDVTVTGGNPAGTWTQTGLSAAQLTGSAGVLLTNGTDVNDTITLRIPSSALKKDNDGNVQGLADAFSGKTLPLGTATPQKPSGNLGLSSKSFLLAGGTEGGPQTIMNLTGIAIGANGVITASHASGKLTIGRIDLANFDNAKGLQASGNSYFAETENSGKPSYAVPGEDGTGALKNSALEMSNVDLSQEFTDMITTQRGFQANGRIITVSDTMLEELINLKR